MKVTGTKKLLIILFALTCALALGFGVVIARNASTGKGGVAYAEVTLPEADGSETSAEDGEEVSDAEEEKAEEEYDPRYDEGVIAEIAEKIGYRADLLNIYLRLNNFDANEILQHVKEAQEAEALIGKENAVAFTPEEAENGDLKVAAEFNELSKKASFVDELIQDILAFNGEYEKGNVTVSEEDTEKDWYIAPDDFSSYKGSATSILYVGYNN